MNTSQLENFVASDVRTSEKFRGVLTADALPRQPCSGQTDAAYIVNTDPFGKPGEHWVAFYVDPRLHRVEFFDSFAASSPSVYNTAWTKWARTKALCGTARPVCLLQSRRVIQSANSATCGLYCLYYLVRRSRGTTLEQIVNELSASGARTLNDRQILAWWRRQNRRDPAASTFFNSTGQGCCKYGDCQKRHPELCRRSH